DDRRLLGQDELGHADLLPVVGVVAALEGQLLERETTRQRLEIRSRVEYVEEQDIAGGQHRAGRRHDQLLAEALAALDRQQVDAFARPQVERLERLPDQWRRRLDAQAELAPGER